MIISMNWCVNWVILEELIHRQYILEVYMLVSMTTTCSYQFYFFCFCNFHHFYVYSLAHSTSFSLIHYLAQLITYFVCINVYLNMLHYPRSDLSTFPWIWLFLAYFECWIKIGSLQLWKQNLLKVSSKAGGNWNFLWVCSSGYVPPFTQNGPATNL
jgi:hypothetical protein